MHLRPLELRNAKHGRSGVPPLLVNSIWGCSLPWLFLLPWYLIEKSLRSYKVSLTSKNNILAKKDLSTSSHTKQLKQSHQQYQDHNSTVISMEPCYCRHCHCVAFHKGITQFLILNISKDNSIYYPDSK